MTVTKQDTNGIKPVLNKAELGYDNYPAGGDVGRLYIGTGVENIALAKKSEIDELYIFRADRYLSGLNIANMLYTSGDLVKIRYTNDADVDYETFSYTSGNLSSINHYIGSVLKGTTTLSYTDSNLVSAIFVGV